MYRITVGIDGMACGMCESHVNDTIRKNFTVKKVKSSSRKATAVIVSEQAIDEAALKAALDPTGYRVTSVLCEEK